MFSKEEAKERKVLFWTAYGKFMQKHVCQYTNKRKWVNYNTGIREIYFRLECTPKSAHMAIEIQHKDDGIRALIYEQFQELKAVLHGNLNEEWIWEEVHYNQFQQPISRIYISHIGVNIYNKDTWKDAFEFFEPRIVALDVFWSEFNEIFKGLIK